VKFTDNLNVISGSSAVGKSIVYKALYWLCTCSSSTNIHSHGTKSTKVVATFADGNIVTREVMGNNNAYYLNDVRFSACNGKVPDPILNVIRLNDINFQGQFDKMFLLDLTAGNRAKVLNEIIDMSEIDNCVAEINRQTKSQYSKIDVLKANKLALSSDLSKLSNVDYIVTLYNEVEQMQLTIDNKQRLVDSINETNTNITSIETKISKLPDIELASSLIVEIEQLYKNYIFMNTKLEELTQLLTSIDKIKKQLPKFSFKDASKLVGSIETMFTELSKKQELVDKVKYNEQQYTKLVDMIDKVGISINSLNAKLAEFHNCPLCDKPLTD